jgi:hypothetical protein
VTSFLDERTPPRLAALLTAVKKLNPFTLISLDPGHIWCSNQTSAISELVTLADYLLLNYREFKGLGCSAGGEPDEAIAARLLERFESDSNVVIVKRPSGVSAFRSCAGEVISEFYPQIPLAEEEIEDATGAGDVFAAGMLGIVGSDALQTELGALLGMSLAKHKLRYVGTRGHAELSTVTQQFLRSRDEARRHGKVPNGVFVAHGRDSQWLAIKDFVQAEFRRPVFTFESGVWLSKEVTEALREYLDKCGFAICVLTAEDLTHDGQRVARQNVIHELGLFQGRYGFDRVLLLLEDGCDFSLRSAEHQTITFPRNGIDKTFWRLRRMLEAKSI